MRGKRYSRLIFLEPLLFIVGERRRRSSDIGAIFCRDIYYVGNPSRSFGCTNYYEERFKLLHPEYNSIMKSLIAKSIGALIALLAISGALLFLPAWTFHYWQAWTYLAVFMISVSAIVIYLIKNDPELLLRRMNNKEEEKSQKIIHFLVNLAFAVLSIIPALDHRFGWSSMPVYVVVVGEGFVALGMLVIFFVFKENTFTASTIEVSADHKVVSTGPYAVVRHPMYVGGLIFIIGIPLALGSWWGLLMVLPFALILAWRILDEERFLTKNLPGYAEYRNKVKYRLAPFIW